MMRAPALSPAPLCGEHAGRTKSGGTFTFGELREDLESAGFGQAAVLHQDEGMSSIVVARKAQVLSIATE